MCPGGKCINTPNGASCSCGLYQNYDNRQKKCVPENCATKAGMCGKATCEDTPLAGPKCICLTANYIYHADIKECKPDYCRLGHCGSASCTNSAAKANCKCGATAIYDPKAKKCKNSCSRNVCPRDSTCKTKLVGDANLAKKDCICSGGRIYWQSQNVCRDDYCKKTSCGQATCRNTYEKAVCDCPPNKYFMSNKTCQGKQE